MYLLWHVNLFYLCVWVFSFMCTTCMSSAQGGQKRALDCLKLELRVTMSYHLDAKIQTQGPLQKQQILLTTEPSLPPAILVLPHIKKSRDTCKMDLRLSMSSIAKAMA